MPNNKECKLRFYKGLGFLFFFILFFFVFSLFSNTLKTSILKKVQTITDFGPRPSGSKALKQTQNYILTQLQKAGLDTQTFPFVAKTPMGEIHMVNLYAKQKKNHQQKILFAAHYESKLFASFDFVGANDSASGVAVLLQLASFVAQAQCPFEIGFIFFDGEEAFAEWGPHDSLFGSRHQALLWEKEGFLKNIEAFILLDMVGDKNATFCHEEFSCPKLTKEIWKAAHQVKAHAYFKNCASAVEDDHLPFVLKKVPSVDIIHYPFPDYWHTAKDTHHNLSEETLQKVQATLTQFLKNRGCVF